MASKASKCRKIKTRKKKNSSGTSSKPSPRKGSGEALWSYMQLLQNKGDIKKIKEEILKLQDRCQTLEIQNNMLSRLLTTLCIEKFGMRVGVLKRLIRRVEREAIRDAQVHHLEHLYNMPFPAKSDSNPSSQDGDDHWEEIS